MNRRGFTLIELAAVVVVMAMLAGFILYRVRSESIDAARMDDAVDTVFRFDRLARIEARRSGRQMVWRIDPRTGLLQTRPQDAQADRSGLRLALQGRFAIGEVRVADSDGTEFGCTPDGRTPAYAVRVVDTRDDTPGQWVVFAGLTGQGRKVTDDANVDAIVRPSPPRRDDTR